MSADCRPSFVFVASFASSILSFKNHSMLVIGMLQLIELLLAKMPSEYKPMFCCESIFHEIEVLALQTITSSRFKDKDKSADKDISEASSPDDTGISMYVPVSITVITSISGYKKSSSLSIKSDNVITLYVHAIQFK